MQLTFAGVNGSSTATAATGNAVSISGLTTTRGGGHQFLDGPERHIGRMVEVEYGWSYRWMRWEDVGPEAGEEQCLCGLKSSSVLNFGQSCDQQAGLGTI